MTCIYCGSKENLNTQMTIPLEDGSKVTVSVCGGHAEDATIKGARQKYVERKEQIDALSAMARDLGMEIVPHGTASGLVLAKPSATAAQAQRRPAMVAQEADDPEMIDSEVVDRRRRQMTSVGGSVGGHSVESHKSIDTAQMRERVGDEVLRGKVKMEMIERQNGSQVAIPTKTVNGLGTTRVVVVQTTDQDIQRRFKAIAEQSKSPHGWGRMRHIGREGIEIVNCPICRGEGTARERGIEVTCPKCKGRGMLS